MDCPAKYRWELDNPVEQTDAMWWGSVIHTCTLEPDRFHEEFAKATVNRTAKKAWAEEQDAHPTKELLTASEWDEAQAIAQAVRIQPAAGRLLGMGIDDSPVENSLFWECPETGTKCRARMDFMTNCGIIVDLKSAQAAGKEDFSKAAYNFGYHIQAAFYLWGAGICGFNFDNFVFVVVEKKAPYLVSVYAADPEFVALGRSKFQQALRDFAQCQKTNKFPGYGEEIQTLSLPAYAK
jgi:hypothetical protein